MSIPTTSNTSIEIGDADPKVTITCTSSNRNWDIKYPHTSRQGFKFRSIMLSLTNKFVFLKKYESDLISHTSKITHNRQCLEPLANMLLTGNKNETNQYTNHIRQLEWNNTSYQPVWTIEEIYKKEHVPSFIERTWEQMI